MGREKVRKKGGEKVVHCSKCKHLPETKKKKRDIFTIFGEGNENANKGAKYRINFNNPFLQIRPTKENRNIAFLPYFLSW